MASTGDIDNGKIASPERIRNLVGAGKLEIETVLQGEVLARASD